MFERLFCRHKDARVTHWVWTHGPNGNDPRYIEARLKCNNCGKEKYISIKDPKYFDEFTKANPVTNPGHWLGEKSKNKNRILELKSSKDIYEDAIDDMTTIVDLCYAHGIYQPELSTHEDPDDDGILAEWNYDWHIELYISSEINVLLENDLGEKIECNFDYIADAFFLIKTFINKVVDTNKTRDTKKED